MKKHSQLAVGLLTTTALLSLGISPLAAAQDAGASRVPKTVRVGRRTLNTDVVIARRLGTSTKKLRAAINAGESVSQFAADRGSTAAALVRTIIDKVSQILATEVAAGHMTQARADGILAALTTQLTNMLDRAIDSRGLGVRGRIDLFDKTGIAVLFGISGDQLEYELDSGFSLLQIGVNHGVTKETLVAYLTASATKKIEDAVSVGLITVEQAAQLKSLLPAKIDSLINRVEPQTRNAGKHEGFRGPGALIRTKDIAAAIGIPVDQMVRERRGVSIADVALAHGVSLSMLTENLTKVATARIDAALASQSITIDQATALKASLPVLITTLVTQVRGVRHGDDDEKFPVVPATTTPGASVTVPGGPTTATLTTAYLGLKETFFKAAAQSIGIPEELLEDQMKLGLTVLQIAVAKGVDQATLTTALSNAGTSRVGLALATGRITQLQADFYDAAMVALVTGYITTAHHED